MKWPGYGKTDEAAEAEGFGTKPGLM